VLLLPVSRVNAHTLQVELGCWGQQRLGDQPHVIPLSRGPPPQPPPRPQHQNHVADKSPPSRHNTSACEQCEQTGVFSTHTPIVVCVASSA